MSEANRECVSRAAKVQVGGRTASQVDAVDTSVLDYCIFDRVENKALGMAGRHKILIGYLYTLIIRSNFEWPLYKIARKMANGQLLFSALFEGLRTRANPQN